jgi:hypothetical protein
MLLLRLARRLDAHARSGEPAPALLDVAAALARAISSAAGMARAAVLDPTLRSITVRSRSIHPPRG